MSDYEELRDEMQYYENEHYNELRKLEAEENASPTLKADRDSWKARAEKAEAELKEAGKCIYDVETYLQLGSAKFIKRTIDSWRGAKEKKDAD